MPADRHVAAAIQRRAADIVQDIGYTQVECPRRADQGGRAAVIEPSSGQRDVTAHDPARIADRGSADLEPILTVDFSRVAQASLGVQNNVPPFDCGACDVADVLTGQRQCSRRRKRGGIVDIARDGKRQITVRMQLLGADLYEIAIYRQGEIAPAEQLAQSADQMGIHLQVAIGRDATALIAQLQTGERQARTGPGPRAEAPAIVVHGPGMNDRIPARENFAAVRERSARLLERQRACTVDLTVVVESLGHPKRKTVTGRKRRTGRVRHGLAGQEDAAHPGDGAAIVDAGVRLQQGIATAGIADPPTPVVDRSSRYTQRVPVTQRLDRTAVVADVPACSQREAAARLQDTSVIVDAAGARQDGIAVRQNRTVPIAQGRRGHDDVATGSAHGRDPAAIVPDRPGCQLNGTAGRDLAAVGERRIGMVERELAPAADRPRVDQRLAHVQKYITAGRDLATVVL